MKSKSFKIVFGLTIVLLLVFGVVFLKYKDSFLNRQKDSDGTQATHTNSSMIDGVERPILGDPDAPVQIVQFGDYRCPPCGMFDKEIVPEIKEKYIDEGIANFVYINFPFLGIDSFTAANYSSSVANTLSQDDFFKFHQAIYDNQPTNNNEIYSEEFLNSLLEDTLGKKKTDKVLEFYKKESYRDFVNSDLKFAKELKVDVTPTVYINGEKIDSPFDLDEIEKSVMKILKEKNHIEE